MAIRTPNTTIRLAGCNVTVVRFGSLSKKLIEGSLIMRRALILAVVLLTGACAFFAPGGKRFVVFFQGGAVTLDDGAAKAVVLNAAAYALDHPDQTIRVDGFADQNGTKEANAEITRARVQNVIAGLTSNGVPVTRIARREVGEVPFTLDDQEARRVTIVIGRP
eukprot:gene1925-1957_t